MREHFLIFRFLEKRVHALGDFRTDVRYLLKLVDIGFAERIECFKLVSQLEGHTLSHVPNPQTVQEPIQPGGISLLG